MNTWRCMAFFTVCVLLCVGQCEEDLVTHYSKFSLGGGGEPLKPNHTQVLSRLQHSNTQWSPLQQSSTWGSASSPPPACCQSSLLFLLLLLLELLNGIHLSSGAHLAHWGRVLALHHQLIGHLVVFLRRKRKGEKKAFNATSHSEGEKRTPSAKKRN